MFSNSIKIHDRVSHYYINIQGTHTNKKNLENTVVTHSTIGFIPLNSHDLTKTESSKLIEILCHLFI